MIAKQSVHRAGWRVVGAVSALAILAGCSGGTGPSSAEGDSATSGTVNWWGWTPDMGEADELIAAFNEEYPDITVEYKKIQDASYNAALRPALASTSGPDVYNVAAGGATGDVAAFGESAIDLRSALADRGEDGAFDGIYGEGLNAFEDTDGRLKGAPIGQIASGILWINQELFDEYNLTAPTTLDEWKHVCDVFRDNGYGCLAEGIGQPGFDIDTLHSIADSIAPGDFARAAAGEIPWTSDTIVQAFEGFKELADLGILDPGAVGIQQYPDVNNAFLAGKTPIVQMGTWYQQYTTEKALKGAQEAAGLPADQAPVTMVPIAFPDVAGKGNEPALFGDPDYALAVSSKAKSPEAATTFAVWLSTSDVAQQIVADHLTNFPAKTSVTVDWDGIELVDPDIQRPALEELRRRVDGVDQARQADLPSEMIQALVTANQDVIGERKSPQEAAEDVAAVAASLGR